MSKSREGPRRMGVVQDDGDIFVAGGTIHTDHNAITPCWIIDRAVAARTAVLAVLPRPGLSDTRHHQMVDDRTQ